MTPRRRVKAATRSEEEIRKAVRAIRVGGERVVAVAKRFNISRAQMYNWIKREERAALEATPQGQVQQSLQDRNRELESQVKELRDKLVTLMIETGRL